MKHGDKTKSRIVSEANRLFYQQGYNATSISNIVDATGLSKGNITYHYKSKQEILSGIIEQRLRDIDVRLAAWNMRYPSPLDRITRFCEMLLDEQDMLKQYGCPMGTLTGEFAKNQPDLYQITLPLFQRFAYWLAEQFIALGFTSDQAQEKALALLARVQGIAVITHVFKDKAFLNREISKLKEQINHRYASSSA